MHACVYELESARVTVRAMGVCGVWCVGMGYLGPEAAVAVNHAHARLGHTRLHAAKVILPPAALAPSALQLACAHTK